MGADLYMAAQAAMTKSEASGQVFAATVRKVLLRHEIGISRDVKDILGTALEIFEEETNPHGERSVENQKKRLAELMPDEEIGQSLKHERIGNAERRGFESP